MKITRINRIKGHRLFHDFSWPASLDDFGRFNLIYGWNGSGKTTLSGLFRNLEKRQPITEGEVIFKLDNAPVAGSEIGPSTPLPSVRVFNSDFVAASVFATSGALNPIYFLGEDTVEKQKEIETLKGRLAKATQELATARATREKAEADLDKFCISSAQVIKELLSSSGPNTYNNYNKAAFRRRCEAVISGQERVGALTDEQKLDLKKQKDGTSRPKIDPLTASLPDLAELKNRVDGLLSRTVTSQVMAELATDAKLGEWVRQGVAFHTGERHTEQCHFCGSALLKQRLDALEAHFNDEYARFLGELDRTILDIDGTVATCRLCTPRDKGVLYEHLTDSYGKASDDLVSVREGTVRYVQGLRAAIEAKRSAPFTRLSLASFITEQSDPSNEQWSEKLKAVNVFVGQHNSLTANFEQSVGDARQRLEDGHVAVAQAEFRAKAKESTVAIEEIERLQGFTRELNDQIARLESQVIEHRRPAEQLNAELASYLGRNELEFEIQETGYRITRHGVPARHLSEGEKTAIAFLYFLKSLQDRAFDLSKDIVVIDDPVSSLDTNALFCAFGFMKERTKSAGQLFVLTHNFGFFRQVKNWFNHLPGQRKTDATKQPARFYMLEGEVTAGHRGATLLVLDPLLHQYESEYHYLFSKVYAAAYGEDRLPLEECYGLPNIARRLLEAFMAFRFPAETGELRQALERVTFDTARTARIVRFLHTYSHDGKIGEPEHDLSILAESKAVLIDVLALIDSQDHGHYAEMKRLVTSPSAEVEAAQQPRSVAM